MAGRLALIRTRLPRRFCWCADRHVGARPRRAACLLETGAPNSVVTIARVAEEDVSVTATVSGAPDLVYSLVSDVTRMREWSPENTGGRWRRGWTGPVVGAKFSGSNRRGWRRWSTNCTVIAAEPGRRFAFDVALGPVPVSRWTYDFQPVGDFTIVTETWTDRRPRWLDIVAGSTMGIDNIREHNRENMRQTLARLAESVDRTR